MIKNSTLFLLTIAFLLSSVGLKAQIYYNFQTAEPTTNSYSNVAADSVKNGNNNGVTPVRNSTSPSGSYEGASGANNAGAAVFTGGFTPASTYFETTLTPTAGNSIVLTGISFGSRSTGTGPQAASVRTSVDAFASDQATFVLLNSSVWALQSSGMNVTGVAGTPVTIRIYGFNGAGSPGANTANWRIDDLTINPAIPFPLTLTSFKGSLSSAKTVVLNWNTVNESGIKEFSIERGNDARSFTSIGSVVATNGSRATYSFTDAAPTATSNYYRLKMIDRSGSAKYSNVVVINNRRGITASVFPNPVVNSLSITHEKALTGAAVRIIGLGGNVVKVYPIGEGAIQTNLNVSELTKGTYVVVFDNDGQQVSTKFVKQ